MKRLALRAACVLGLLVVSHSAQARQVFEEFNYTFDKGGEFYDFIIDEDLKGSATIGWAAGGAMGSVGCLKCTGADVRLEKYEWFRLADRTISFHYFNSGYKKVSVRLLVATPEQQASYAGFCQYVVTDLKENQWQWVQLRASDLIAWRKPNAKVTPDIIFKTVMFMCEGGDGSSYILLDNIRLGPAITEKDLNVKARAGAARVVGNKQQVLMDFERPEESKLIVSEDGGLRTEISDRWAATGKNSLRLEAPKGQDWVSFQIDPSLLKGWEQYDYLAFDFYSEDPTFTRLAVELWDKTTKNFQTRCTYDELKPLHQGKTRILVDLRRARRNVKGDIPLAEVPKADMIDLSALTRVKGWFGTKANLKDYVCYVDNVRLLQEGALDSNMKITLPSGTRAFDFGEDTPLVAGFTEANLTTVYSKEAGFGFVNPTNLRVEGATGPIRSPAITWPAGIMARMASGCRPASSSASMCPMANTSCGSAPASSRIRTSTSISTSTDSSSTTAR